MPTLQRKNIHDQMADCTHGFHNKSLAVLHETISADIPGWQDIDNNAGYLDRLDYGMHGLTDAEGHIAWANGLGKAIFWQARGRNEIGIGIEQVSNVMLRSPDNRVRRAIWVAREPQLRATAKLLACISRAHDIPLRYDPDANRGVCSHWDVSQATGEVGGHWDCKPYHRGGYYPMKMVISMAVAYKAAGWHF